MKRWQDWCNVVFGVWMLASPGILGYGAEGGLATHSSWILGAAVVLFAGLAVHLHRPWEEAINVLLGICLLVSPWLVGYDGQPVPTANAVVVGALVSAFGLWSTLGEAAIRKWWHEHHRPHGAKSP
jgi:hypothetical protein